MKALTAALALAGSLIAAQAHAATYNFAFADIATATVAPETSALAADPQAAVGAIFHTFTIDTSTAAQGGPFVDTVFNNVSVYFGSALVGTDTITVSAPVTNTTASSSAVTINALSGRTLSGTGSYAFSFNPVSATLNGKNIVFAPGTFTGTDPTNNSAAQLNVSVAAVASAPEPGAWMLMLGGVGAMGLMLRRRRWAAFAA